MIGALQTISVYGPTDIRKTRPVIVFDVTDQCARTANLMGDDLVRIQTRSEENVQIMPLSYVEYNGKNFYTKSVYRPTDEGGIYMYDVSFYSVDNVIERFILQRIASVTDKDGNTITWKESDFTLNANKKTIGEVVCGSIQDSLQRLSGYKIYNEIGGIQLNNNPDYSTSKLVAWDFMGNTITEALDEIATEYECEWWIENYTLFIEKREYSNGEITLYDQYYEGVGLKGNTSGGIVSVAYDSDEISESGRIFPIGSDRNIKTEQATWNGMNISYNHRLKLEPNHTYTIRLADGTTDTLTTDSEGAVSYGNTIGYEQIVEFEDVYPKQTFRITKVTTMSGAEGRTQYNITCVGVNVPTSALNEPIVLAAGVGATVTFESGQLNGFTFDIYIQRGQQTPTTYRTFDFTIVPQVSDSLYLPSGTLIPKINDTFALAGIVMPDLYIAAAREELAAKTYEAYEKIRSYQPPLRIQLEPRFTFENINDLFIGGSVVVNSTLTGPNQYKNRIIYYNYSLTAPYNANIILGDYIKKGILKETEDRIDGVNDNFVGRLNEFTGTYLYVKDGTIQNAAEIGDFKIKLTNLESNMVLLNEVGIENQRKANDLLDRLGGVVNVAQEGRTDYSVSTTVERTEPTMLKVMSGTIGNGSRTFFIPETFINLDDFSPEHNIVVGAIVDEGSDEAYVYAEEEGRSSLRATYSADAVIGRLVFIEGEWVFHYGKNRAIGIEDRNITMSGLITDVTKDEIDEHAKYKDVTIAAKAMFVDRELVLSDSAADKLIERLRERGL